jgi:hypothetical protein
MRTNFFKKILPNKLYVYMVAIYSKFVPSWIIKLLPNRTAPANKRFNFIRDIALVNNIKTFVETGTYLGDTTAALSCFFNKIYTFEISKELVELAKKRFENDRHVEIIQGDSGEELMQILSKINEKTIFWLDGHYSEGFLYSKRYNLDTPVVKEITTIFESNIKNFDNIILIDDAFEFDGTRGYPTIEELKSLVNKFTDRYDVYVKYNIVFITIKNI